LEHRGKQRSGKRNGHEKSRGQVSKRGPIVQKIERGKFQGSTNVIKQIKKAAKERASLKGGVAERRVPNHYRGFMGGSSTKKEVRS